MNRKPLIIFGDGSQSRDFLFVEEAAKAVVAVLETPAAYGQCINFCTGVDTTVRRIAELVLENFSMNPKEMIEYQESRPGDVQRHIGDVSRFRKLLGFTPQVPLEEGIVRTIQWFRKLPISPEKMLAQMATRNWE
jgi:UDP-glucose 4-epimerase